MMNKVKRQRAYTLTNNRLKDIITGVTFMVLGSMELSAQDANFNNTSTLTVMSSKPASTIKSSKPQASKRDADESWKSTPSVAANKMNAERNTERITTDEEDDIFRNSSAEENTVKSNPKTTTAKNKKTSGSYTAANKVSNNRDTIYTKEQKESIDDIIPWWEKLEKFEAPSLTAAAWNELDLFFPVFDTYLCKTSLEEMEKRDIKVIYRPVGYSNAAQIIQTDLFFLDTNRDHYVDEMRIKHVQFPAKWKALGFDWKLSYNQWMSLFEKMNYRLTVTEEPKVTTLVYKYLSATVMAESPNKNVQFMLRFSKGEKGYKLDSPYTLQEIHLKWIKQ